MKSLCIFRVSDKQRKSGVQNALRSSKQITKYHKKKGKQ